MGTRRQATPTGANEPARAGPCALEKLYERGSTIGRSIGRLLPLTDWAVPEVRVHCPNGRTTPWWREALVLPKGRLVGASGPRCCRKKVMARALGNGGSTWLDRETAAARVHRPGRRAIGKSRGHVRAWQGGRRRRRRRSLRALMARTICSVYYYSLRFVIWNKQVGTTK